ncbi:MAG: methyltransferase domain-containing protein [Anaerolineae bacterium]|nr:methyltransferase domain-containing protein [Anaerolineae bacterium]
MDSYSRQRVNYDSIAHLYDEPRRDYAPDQQLTRFLSERSLAPSSVRALDMGCGTGKQVAANHAAYPAMSVFGSDLFAGMLGQARRRSDVPLVQGDSSCSPFRAASIDYISNQFSYQHVLDKPAMLAETYRLLRSGGRFVMTNIDPWSMRNWAIYTYFPAAWDRDILDFLSADAFTDLMRQIGFVNIAVSRRHQPVSEPLPQYFAYASQRFRNSQFMCISDDDYARGVATLKAELSQRGDSATIASEICFVTICGDKP